MVMDARLKAGWVTEEELRAQEEEPEEEGEAEEEGAATESI